MLLRETIAFSPGHRRRWVRDRGCICGRTVSHSTTGSRRYCLWPRSDSPSTPCHIGNRRSVRDATRGSLLWLCRSQISAVQTVPETPSLSAVFSTLLPASILLEFLLKTKTVRYRFVVTVTVFNSHNLWYFTANFTASLRSPEWTSASKQVPPEPPGQVPSNKRSLYTWGPIFKKS